MPRCSTYDYKKKINAINRCSFLQNFIYGYSCFFSIQCSTKNNSVFNFNTEFNLINFVNIIGIDLKNCIKNKK